MTWIQGLNSPHREESPSLAEVLQGETAPAPVTLLTVPRENYLMTGINIDDFTDFQVMQRHQELCP